MAGSKNGLQERLARYRQVTITITPSRSPFFHRQIGRWSKSSSLLRNRNRCLLEATSPFDVPQEGALKTGMSSSMNFFSKTHCPSSPLLVIGDIECCITKRATADPTAFPFKHEVRKWMPETDYERALVGMVMLQRERNGALFGVHGLVRSKSA